jgi:ketosteroid isomerase-like protein
MAANTPSEPDAHSLRRRETIERAVTGAALRHLNAPDADTALSYYVRDAVVASEGRLYESFDAFAQDVRAFYESLLEVHMAAWHEPQVQVLGDRAAVFTASVRWVSTDTAGCRLDLRGVWTAVWLERPEGWRIAVRHESFIPSAAEPDAAV